MSRWIITDRAHPLVQKGLEQMGFQVDWMADIGHDELLTIIDRYEGMVISSKTAVQREMIDRAVNLRIVARLGSGMEHVDTGYCESKGIACLSSPEGNANAVAEHAFGMLLALSNRILAANNQLRKGIWEREVNRGFELKGKSLGIIGYGHTGSAFAAKFRGWGMDVMAYDKYKQGFGNGHVRETGYDELLEQADIISFHIPLNKETMHWINADFIAACKEDIILINTSRGGIADTPSLINGLASGKISGICIDVFEDEPLSNGIVHKKEVYDKLLSYDRVVATPHIAGWSRESKLLLVETLLLKIEKTLKKQSTQRPI